MCGELVRCRAVVEVDGEHAVHGLCLDGDEGDAALAQDGHGGVEAGATSDQHNGVDRRVLDADLSASRVGEQQQAGADRTGLVGEAIEHGDVHGVAEGVAQPVFDDDADNSGAAAAQRLGTRIRTGVVERCGRGEHALSGSGRDGPGTAEGERCRGGGDPRERRHRGQVRARCLPGVCRVAICRVAACLVTHVLIA